MTVRLVAAMLTGLALSGLSAGAAPEKSAPAGDPAYAAFQRGQYLTAYREALPLARNGDAASRTLLGELFSKGLGVPRNLPAAANWYRLAAEQGDRHAQFALAQILLRDKRPEAAEQGLDFLQRAARQGHAIAQLNLGTIHIAGKWVPRDPIAASGYFEAAAKQGNREAQYSLGRLYADGIGLPQDWRKAARWIGRAAGADLPDAQLDYGIMVFKGRGVAADEASGASWILSAAEFGNPIAQNRMAHLYANGRGVAENHTEAAKWYLVSRTRGKQDKVLESLLKTLDEKALAKARQAAEAWRPRYQARRSIF